jgi:hypothetical protein
MVPPSSFSAERAIAVANALKVDRYAAATAVFAAGSIVRGEGTPFSDLDLVVVYPRLDSAYRESLRFEGLPVEAFVHDSGTLAYFFTELDRASGVPSLAQMVSEGVEIPQASETSRDLKEFAASIIAAGPPALDAPTERRMRYAVSDLIEDLRAPRSRNELIAAGARLYEELADYHLRRQRLWSAKGKSIPRVLRSVDPDVAEKYAESFDSLFARGDAAPVIRLAEELLGLAGGLLFEGYRADAPPAWRK